MKHRILLYLLLLLATSGFSQSGKVSFFATAEPATIQTGESFTLSFTLSNTSGSDFIPPDLHDFTVINGPNRSVSVQSINGAWKQVTEYSFTLMPKRAGHFNIGPATIVTKKGSLETQPVDVVVNDASGIASMPQKGLKKADGKKDFFVEVVTDKSSAYTGEQVLVDFVFYTRVSVQDFRIMEEPTFGGAYAQELQYYEEPQSQVDINGTGFIRKHIKRYAVFPQESGKTEIQPMTLEVNVFTDTNDPFSGFFRRETETKYFTTEKSFFKVETLPDGAPKNFLGAVGNWNLELSPVSTHISKNDALTLLLTVTGDGDIKNVQMPNMKLSYDFEMYAPKTVEENTSEKNGRLVSKKVFEIMLLPKAEGTFSIPAEYSWFDTNKKHFESKIFGPFSIVVNKAIPHESTEDDQSTDSTSAPVPALKKYLAVFAGIVILGTLIWSIFFIRAKKKTTQNVVIKDSNQVTIPTTFKQSVAIADPVKGLQVYLNNADQEKFYSQLQKNLTTFLIQKLQIQNPNASQGEIISHLEKTGHDTVMISKIKTIFTNCEQVLYAGFDKSAMMLLMVEHLEDIKNRLNT